MAEHARADRARAAPRPAAPVVVIGVGNALRHDDAAGLETVRRLRLRPTDTWTDVKEHEGETLGLLELWAGARVLVLVDAVRSGAPPGTIHRLDASARPIRGHLRGFASTHALEVGEAIELARSLGRLPNKVVLFGVEGRCFDVGAGLSPEVEEAVEELARAVLEETRALSAA